MTHKLPHHHHTLARRGIYCFVLIASVLVIGTLGLRITEHFSLIDSFYFACLIATGQGPAPEVMPATVPGKLFICFLAFLSTGTIVAAAGYLFGPFFGLFWKMGVDKMEEEVKHLKHKG